MRWPKRCGLAHVPFRTLTLDKLRYSTTYIRAGQRLTRTFTVSASGLPDQDYARVRMPDRKCIVRYLQDYGAFPNKLPSAIHSTFRSGSEVREPPVTSVS